MKKNIIYLSLGAALLYFYTKKRDIAGKRIKLTEEEQEKLNERFNKDVGNDPWGVKARGKAIEDAGGTIDEIQLIRE